ncbi:MAG: NAD(P)/FAD-dependent oxidoreductase [Ignavibacteria bacterium]|jgi:flavin-dependent dehydrogenase|nr:NAD(P)/FAD-dependent oxidoreductase [Ignavibacteria bacterium]MCU7502051.1 NAD(P)/FAD-dependent oxidoreductase [Ignavibacteria bacterium]MCU7515453.1 NAD(P)/FAD-dependent oxidoreductase [Ignavibacteria bacterium]
MDSAGIYEVAVVGGGPAGSSAAFRLARQGFNVCLIEKKTFPRETLCGEFISREATEILNSLGLFKKFLMLHPNPIHSFSFILSDGRKLKTSLNFTGYGLKRGSLDNFLLKSAIKEGIDLLQPASAKEISQTSQGYALSVLTPKGTLKLLAKNVIAAYGRQSPLDRELKRDFTGIKTRLNGLKLHVPCQFAPNFPEDEIHIYVGKGIYCGVNRVDRQTLTVCFLEDRTDYEPPPRVRLKELISMNRSFKEIFSPDIFTILDSLPVYGTGNIYFGKRNCVENGIFMAGDAARVIAPLSGDGIAMALQSAELACEAVSQKLQNKLGEKDAENFYTHNYRKLFSPRLRTALLLQKTILKPDLSKPAYFAAKMFPGLLSYFINSTRGII